jgi:hypothetical protein|tara:strand:- start:6338 stop:6529 length:192 start_codon:yes stop_codon:yes gene_type:complete
MEDVHFILWNINEQRIADTYLYDSLNGVKNALHDFDYPQHYSILEMKPVHRYFPEVTVDWGIE